jgi:hypothetical protein
VEVARVALQCSWRFGEPRPARAKIVSLSDGPACWISAFSHASTALLALSITSWVRRRRSNKLHTALSDFANATGGDLYVGIGETDLLEFCCLPRNRRQFSRSPV